MLQTGYEIYMFPVNLSLFDGKVNTNTTGDSGLSDEMKTYYSDYLIDLAEPKLVHDQFAQKHPIPKNGGKTIEFRKWNPLPKILTPLQEGVTPDGQKLSMSVINATVDQYGGYATISDILQLTAVDNSVVQATKMLASQAGRSLDTITREVLVGGTNVLFAGGMSANIQARHQLKVNSAVDCRLKVDDIKRAVRILKNMNAEKFGSSYVAIIHPDCSYDLTNDPDWKYPHQYVDTANVYSGEIGAIAGCRFVETTEAKIFEAEDLLKVTYPGEETASRTLTSKEAISNAKTFAVTNTISTDQQYLLRYRTVIIDGNLRTIVSATSGTGGNATITLDEAVTTSAAVEIYPGEAGAEGKNVYATLVLAENAYGVTEISGGGLQHIVKQLGSAGTADPINQRSTVGWKATKVAKRLVEEYMVRIESLSSFS